MTKTEQKTFIKELTANVAKDMLALVDAGKVPEDWDGHELRQWIADRYAQVSFGSFADNKRAKRFQAYRNAVIVNNL